MGIAINTANSTNLIKSLDNNATNWPTDAPSTFRIPISLVRRSAEKAANPSKPKAEMSKAIKANKTLPPGLRELASDKSIIGALDVTADEWVALASLRLQTTIDKSGYLTILTTIRSVTKS